MRVLVTGATGFVGGPVCRRLADSGWAVAGAIRRPAAMPPGIAARVVGDIGPETNWREALAGIDAVVHLTARAHVMRDTESDPLAVFRRINRDATLRLAEECVRAGVPRLLFASSIKVNGEATPPGRPFRAEDAPRPVDAYGIAKAEAEEGLARIAAATSLGVTVIRPPLVHGPGAKGNLAALMAALRRRLPLPLGRIANRRSLIGVGNLAEAVRFCLADTRTVGATYLVRDGEDVSTPELIRRLGAALDAPARLLPVPVAALRLAGTLAGKGAAVDRLAGSLVVDDAPLRALGWSPPLGLDAGLAAMAAGINPPPAGGA